MGKFARYRLWQRAALGFVVIYVGIVAITGAERFRNAPPFVTNHELLPFFNWSLFSAPARYQNRFTVIAREITASSPLSGRLGRPLSTEDADFLRQIQFQKVATRYERAVRKGWSSQRDLKKQLDNFTTDAGILRYDFVLEQHDPLIRDGESLIATTILEPSK